VIGKLKPWHGAWMVEIVHQVAPEAQIMPIIGRSQKGDGFQDYLILGIRYAAEHGAVAVSSSMGPVDQTEALRAAIDFAEQHGTVFVNVHPENIAARGESFRPCAPASCDRRILHTGVVSVPDHETRPSDARQVYTWPYDLAAKFKDGWGYSNAPPVAAGVIALMKSANPRLTPEELRQLLRETTYDHEGFRVLDAEAAVRAAWNEAARLVPELPRFAGGKSFGGRMTSRSHAAEAFPGLRGIVFLGFPLHPPEKPGTERADHLAEANGPLLFLQGTRDDLAPLPRLRPVIKKLGRRATLHVVDGADHGFDVLVRSGRTHAEVLDELARTIAAWMTKHAR